MFLGCKIMEHKHSGTDNNLYSEIILDYYKNPINFGEIKKPDLRASGGNISCGDTVALYIKFDKEKITEISFTGQGCAISRAGSCVLTEIVQGKKVGEILKMNPNTVLDELGGTIQTRMKCALLGLNVIKKALSEWKKNPTPTLTVANINI